MPSRRHSLACSSLAVVFALVSPLSAQHGGGHGGLGGAMGSRPGGFGAARDRRNGSSADNRPDSAGTQRAGLQLGPPGRWWDDKHFAKSLKLRTDQQQRMDSLFEQNRPVLLRRYETLEQEQLRMESLLHASVLDESGLNAQIDRISQARADLEKANTHYLLQLRGEMDPDQIARLEGRQ